MCEFIEFEQIGFINMNLSGDVRVDYINQIFVLFPYRRKEGKFSFFIFYSEGYQLCTLYISQKKF